MDKGIGRQITSQGGDGQAGEDEGQQAAFEHGHASTVKVHEASVKMTNRTMIQSSVRATRKPTMSFDSTVEKPLRRAERR